MVDICIQRRDDGNERWSWVWQVDGAHLGLAIAILERVKWAACHAANYPDARPPGWQVDPFDAIEPERERKICIHYEPTDDLIGTNVRSLSATEAVEGLLDAQLSMAELWMGRKEPIAAKPT